MIEKKNDNKPGLWVCQMRPVFLNFSEKPALLPSLIGRWQSGLEGVCSELSVGEAVAAAIRL